MKSPREQTIVSRSQDKQLRSISFDSVLEKRRLDQALNVKEFAVCAGVSYSTARSWFRLPGFPVFRRIVFWQDFVQWRAEEIEASSSADLQRNRSALPVVSTLPPRAAQILYGA